MSARSKCVTWGITEAESVMRWAMVRLQVRQRLPLDRAPLLEPRQAAGGSMPTGVSGAGRRRAVVDGAATGEERPGVTNRRAARTIVVGDATRQRPVSAAPRAQVARPSSRASRRVAGVAATGVARVAR